MALTTEVLRIDAEAAAAEIIQFIRDGVRSELRRKGAVVGLSGGVDSSVVAELCVRALGPERVLGLFMPERDSSDSSLRLGRACADRLGIATLVEDVEPILDAAGCYRRQLAAIRQVFPEAGEGYRFRLTLPSLLQGDRLSISRLTIESPDGEQKSSRMPAAAYLELVAATNFKQRVRKMIEYHHADRLHFAVAGTPNFLELDQGFFVKQGDGTSDIEPIAHLYKSQVFALAEHLGVPSEIRSRAPTTETYSLPQTQEEFFFCLPYPTLDMCLYGFDHDAPAEEVAAALGLDDEQVETVYRDIEQKRRAARYLRRPPLMLRKRA